MRCLLYVPTLLIFASLAHAEPGERYVPSPEELRKSYDRANGIFTEMSNRVFKSAIKPNWLAGDKRFWYRNELRGGSSEFILVDAERGTREPAFNHEKLAKSLSKASGDAFDPDRLPFQTIQFSEDGTTIEFSVQDVRWKCDLSSYEVTRMKGKHPQISQIEQTSPLIRESVESAKSVENADDAPQPGKGRSPAPRRTEFKSPDEKWIAILRTSNLILKNVESGKETELTKDGIVGNAYGNVRWSPDSKRIVAYRTEPGDDKEVYRVESSPQGGGRAKLLTSIYPQPGDKFAAHEMWFFEIDSAKAIKVEAERIDFGRAPEPHWKNDGRHFLYSKTDRGHQRYRVIEVDSHTGKTREIIDEKSKTFVNSYSNFTISYQMDSEEIVFSSERDGWNHLYLIDMKTGKVKNPITKGEFVVRGIDRTDEKERQIWFRACGKNADQDPYFMNYYRVNFDGTGLVELTSGNGTHTVQYSPDRKFLVDTWSRPDVPPVHELRKVSDGSLVCELEKADISALKETGWNAPEVFIAKARDGKTDIWGIVVRPRHFDPKRKYPIIEYIYAGPHGSFVPKQFRPVSGMAALAELGFIVVQCDGMGTCNRSKAFHDVCWKNVGDAGFPDRILWIKALAAKHPYMDLERIGIYGTSAGGQSSTGALLFHPEFYKVAVSSCGCHDNRMDKSSWNEQWMGYPVGPHYAEQSNITNAPKLRGKLLLLVGELDTNVPPESTYRLVDALIKAKKNFDFVMLPGFDHTDGGPYGEHKRRDFFVKHLLGVDPPEWNSP